ncbi:MAG: ribonuclease Z [Clostridiales bacterium]|jgi:ribonuclease Z|nr:ribonuclease Z [Clostridiales bacterium]
MLDVALLGTGGMMPLPNRFLTSLLLRFNGRMLMVDCGECTQVTLKLLGWGFKNIDIICFTHFHADHIAGLPGLLLTVGNSDRTEPVWLVGPPGLRSVAESLCVIAQDIPFPLEIIELPYTRSAPPETLALGEFLISVCPVDHRVPCFAYSMEFKRAGRFDMARAQDNNVPLAAWNRLQKNETVTIDGRVFTPDMVLGPPRKSIKTSYCTDTRPVALLKDFVRDSDLFICEGLYADTEKLPKAVAHKHMIFQEAARIARAAQVKELWLTHFSPSLTAPESFVNAARDIFPNTTAGKDRMTKTIRYEEDDVESK